ncbi:MAG TPA: ImmA/IrrE family metallo-endopeptidase [Pyrinomonadaceae bacterium]|nr:ImmA/IrrE family metallo-endopeptidase [Pyrinomonadaceae bacterium]
MENVPPTRKGRHHELRGQGLREFAGLTRDDQRLDPFELAKYAGLLVVTFDQIESLLTEETLKELLGSGKDNWSGGAASQKLPNGKKLIILNPTHAKTRHKATLMEEISHVFLGHKPSRLSIENRDKDGNTIARDYNAEIEEEAYSTGAAALVPYGGLKKFVEDGKTAAEIARHYNVSKALVEYRIKISRLWDTYKERIFRSER